MILSNNYGQQKKRQSSATTVEEQESYQRPARPMARFDRTFMCRN